MIKKVILLLIRLGSGILMFMQGYEKLTGGFAIDGLVPVVIQNQDSPEWYKSFFEHVVASFIPAFNWLVPLGEIAIGLALIFGVMTYTASFFGAFMMLNYILADMIFSYPTQLFFFIIILMNKQTIQQLDLRLLYRLRKRRGDGHVAHPDRG